MQYLQYLHGADMLTALEKSLMYKMTSKSDKNTGQKKCLHQSQNISKGMNCSCKCGRWRKVQSAFSNWQIVEQGWRQEEFE